MGTIKPPSLASRAIALDPSNSGAFALRAMANLRAGDDEAVRTLSPAES